MPTKIEERADNFVKKVFRLQDPEPPDTRSRDEKLAEFAHRHSDLLRRAHQSFKRR